VTDKTSAATGRERMTADTAAYLLDVPVRQLVWHPLYRHSDRTMPTQWVLDRRVK